MLPMRLLTAPFSHHWLSEPVPKNSFLVGLPFAFEPNLNRESITETQLSDYVRLDIEDGKTESVGKQNERHNV